MNLFQEFEERKIDYNKIWQSCEALIVGEKADISIIIPVHGRTQFNHIISDAFVEAIQNINKNISLTIVEHSKEPEHELLCKDWVNYIWIPQGESRFNKCLCFNIGILYGPKAKYYLFHDVDILVPEDFFNLLFENTIGYDAVQAFSGQRLFHCDYYLTESILKGAFPIDKLKTTTQGITPAKAGAEGGSIFCTKQIVKATGGFPSWGYSQYSVEDSHFFRTLQLMGKVGFCNEPPIDCFHLFHPPSFGRQTQQEDWNRYYAFMAMSEEGKRHLIELQAEHFNKYFNE